MNWKFSDSIGLFPEGNIWRVVHAGGQHVPLRLCTPSEESSSKLKMLSPASARPSNADDSLSIDDTDPVMPAPSSLFAHHFISTEGNFRLHR